MMSVDEVVANQVKSDNPKYVFLDNGSEIDWSIVPASLLWPSMKAAVALATEAVVEDYKRHYKIALKLYKESEKHFLHAIHCDATSDYAKNELSKKLKQYQDRAKTLTSYLDERRRIQKLKELTFTETV